MSNSINDLKEVNKLNLPEEKKNENLDVFNQLNNNSENSDDLDLDRNDIKTTDSRDGDNCKGTEESEEKSINCKENNDQQDQLCRDMQDKLHLQNEMNQKTQSSNSETGLKSPVNRPRSVFTYANEQDREFTTPLRSTISAPNACKINEFFPEYERNNATGSDFRSLNQSASEYVFTTKYYSSRITPEFEPNNYQYGQNTFRSTSKDSDYIVGKNNKETQFNSLNPLPSWRTSSRISIPSKIPVQMTNSNTIIPTLPPPMSTLNYYNTDEMQHYTAIDNWREHDLMEPGIGGAMVTPHGTITLRLHDRVRVDMTLDRAVRVVNFKNNIVVSVSATGSASGLLHPNGRVYQYGSRVEILAHDQHTHNNKYAKMWYKGVSFTSDNCALVYLVDSAGTRTTTDSFSDLGQDFSLSIFYNESRHGPQYVQEALNVLQNSQYWITEDGTENWIINNVRISQTADGLVRIGRNSNKFSLRTSPANGSASVSSPYVHCTGSLGQTSHLFVRRGERRMHYDGASFIVRNAGHSAGFDDKNQLKVY